MLKPVQAYIQIERNMRKWERDRVGMKKKGLEAIIDIKHKICEKDVRERYEKGAVIYILSKQ